MAEWQKILNRPRLLEHESWLERGKTGPGRLELEGCDLRGAELGGTLNGARWVRCDLRGARVELASMQDIELVECQVHQANLRGCDLEGALLEGCCFSQANLRMIDPIQARVLRCDFRGAKLERSSWTGSAVEGCDFRGAVLQDAVLDQARFGQCDFRQADLSWSQGPPLGTAYQAHFLRCDFRGAEITRLRLQGTVFERCGFHGLRGAPVLEAPCQVLDPDFSASFDGSDVRPQQSPW